MAVDQKSKVDEGGNQEKFDRWSNSPYDASIFLKSLSLEELEKSPSFRKAAEILDAQQAKSTSLLDRYGRWRYSNEQRAINEVRNAASTSIGSAANWLNQKYGHEPDEVRLAREYIKQAYEHSGWTWGGVGHAVIAMATETVVTKKIPVSVPARIAEVSAVLKATPVVKTLSGAASGIGKTFQSVASNALKQASTKITSYGIGQSIGTNLANLSHKIPVTAHIGDLTLSSAKQALQQGFQTWKSNFWSSVPREAVEAAMRQDSNNQELKLGGRVYREQKNFSGLQLGADTATGAGAAALLSAIPSAIHGGFNSGSGQKLVHELGGLSRAFYQNTTSRIGYGLVGARAKFSAELGNIGAAFSRAASGLRDSVANGLDAVMTPRPGAMGLRPEYAGQRGSFSSGGKSGSTGASKPSRLSEWWSKTVPGVFIDQFPEYARRALSASYTFHSYTRHLFDNVDTAKSFNVVNSLMVLDPKEHTKLDGNFIVSFFFKSGAGVADPPKFNLKGAVEDFTKAHKSKDAAAMAKSLALAKESINRLKSNISDIFEDPDAVGNKGRRLIGGSVAARLAAFHAEPHVIDADKLIKKIEGGSYDASDLSKLKDHVDRSIEAFKKYTYETKTKGNQGYPVANTQMRTEVDVGFIERPFDKQLLVEYNALLAANARGGHGIIHFKEERDALFKPHYTGGENILSNNTNIGNMHKPVEQRDMEFAFSSAGVDDPEKWKSSASVFQLKNQVNTVILENIDKLLAKGDRNRVFEALKWVAVQYNRGNKAGAGERKAGIMPETLAAIQAKYGATDPELVNYVNHLREMQQNSGPNNFRAEWTNAYNFARNRRYFTDYNNEVEMKKADGENEWKSALEWKWGIGIPIPVLGSMWKERFATKGDLYYNTPLWAIRTPFRTVWEFVDGPKSISPILKPFTSNIWKVKQGIGHVLTGGLLKDKWEVPLLSKTPLVGQRAFAGGQKKLLLYAMLATGAAQYTKFPVDPGGWVIGQAFGTLGVIKDTVNYGWDWAAGNKSEADRGVFHQIVTGNPKWSTYQLRNKILEYEKTIPFVPKGVHKYVPAVQYPGILAGRELQNTRIVDYHPFGHRREGLLGLSLAKETNTGPAWKQITGEGSSDPTIKKSWADVANQTGQDQGGTTIKKDAANTTKSGKKSWSDIANEPKP